MPIYEYRCVDCGTLFERMRPVGSAEAVANCPECAGTGDRLLSAFASSEGPRIRGPDSEPFRRRDALPQSTGAVKEHEGDSQEETKRMPLDEAKGRDDVAALAAETDRLRLERDGLKEEIGRLTSEQLRREEKGKELGGEIERLNSQRESLLAEMNRLEDQRQGLRADVPKLESAEKEVLSLDHHKQRVQQSLGRLQDEIRSRQHSVYRWQQREQDLTLRLRELEKRQQTVESELLETEPRQRQVRRLRSEEEKLRVEVDHLVLERDTLADGNSELQRQEQELSDEVDRLGTRVRDLDTLLQGWDRVAEELGALGLTPEQLPGLVPRIAEIAARHGISRSDVTDKLLTALEQLSEDLDLAEMAAPRKQELEEIERRINEQQEAERELKEKISELTEERQRLATTLPELESEAQTRLREAGEEAASSLREGAQALRRELDSLLKEVMEVSGKAAEIDADIRSKEWLTRLLTLLEGGNGIRPPEVRALGLIILEGFLNWLANHEDVSPGDARSDMQRLVHTFHEWRG